MIQSLVSTLPYNQGLCRLTVGHVNVSLTAAVQANRRGDGYDCQKPIFKSLLAI